MKVSREIISHSVKSILHEAQPYIPALRKSSALILPPVIASITGKLAYDAIQNIEPSAFLVDFTPAVIAGVGMIGLSARSAIENVIKKKLSWETVACAFLGIAGGLAVPEMAEIMQEVPSTALGLLGLTVGAIVQTGNEIKNRKDGSPFNKRLMRIGAVSLGGAVLGCSATDPVHQIGNAVDTWLESRPFLANLQEPTAIVTGGIAAVGTGLTSLFATLSTVWPKEKKK